MSENQVQADTPVENTDDLDAFTSTFFGEKKEVTPEAKPEAEQDEEKVDGEEAGTESQNETNDELTDEDEEKAEAELAEAKPKSKVQERIDELVKQREDIKREAAANIDKLRKEFEEAIAAIKNPAKQEQKTVEPEPDVLNEDGSPKYPLAEFDPAYIRDLTRYTLEQERAQAKIAEEKERQKTEQLNAEQALRSSWEEKLTPAKERYPDFQEKGAELINRFQNLDPSYGQYLTNLIMSMDNGPDVLYYLSNNRDEATKIVNSGAQKATLALGRIEAKFIEADAEKQLAKPKVSKAPPPPTASARGTGGGARTVAPDTNDLDAFSSMFFKKGK